MLSGFEETGRARRGYFVEGLGAAQFATGATVDRLRSFTRASDAELESSADSAVALTLAATDPANPYGAALPWPNAPSASDATSSESPASPSEAVKRGHRPGRKAGALVVLVDGHLVFFVERGGKTVLTFGGTDEQIVAAAASLATSVRRTLGRLRVERIDGDFVIGTPVGEALSAAGFSTTPQGLRLRG